MLPNLKLTVVVVESVFITLAPITNSAQAVSAEVAKQCGALTAKAFPPRVPGNPAAGSTKGTGAEQRAYYKKCIENEGKMPD